MDSLGPAKPDPRSIPLLVRACRRERTERTPVWFMRQAGRCLAEYRALRERYGILEMARTPELCARVTRMPVDRLGVDGAVLYADIMLPLDGMGIPFRIEPDLGPIVDAPIRTVADVRAIRVADAEDATPYLFETIRGLRRELPSEVALIGFAGAPFTLASYLIEGRPSRDYARTKAMLFGTPDIWHELMATTSEVISRYLRAQVVAGAQVVQLFDSWAGALAPADYERAVLPYTRRIFASLADLGVPRIHFATGNPLLLPLMARAACDVVSVDWRVPLDEAWSAIGPDLGIQGNLDPGACLAPFDVIAERTRDVLRRAGGRPGHVFNLGHGVLPETDADVLARLSELVHTETSSPGRADPGGGLGPTERRNMTRGVVLMTYGAPRTAAEVPAYLSRIRGGKPVADEVLAEMTRRYEAIGWSPIVERTQAQASALERELGTGWRVVAGMRYSAPSLADAVGTLDGVSRIRGIVMSPQWSPAIMGGYERALAEAAAARTLPVSVAQEWHREPLFIDAIAERVREAIARLRDPAILFTAHSLPKRVFDAEPGYVEQLKETAALVARRAALAPGRWWWAYQSAGHTAEAWLRPDLKEVFPALAAAGERDVLVVPVQFLADHLEVLYDLDVAAAAEAAAAGLTYQRIEMPNTHPTFIRALAAVARG